MGSGHNKRAPFIGSIILSGKAMQSQDRSRRELIKGLAASPFLASRSQAAAADRPNILYLHSHDTGRYIEPYGYEVPAPNLKKLAESGVMFRHAFNAAPTCSPTRSSLLTYSC